MLFCSIHVLCLHVLCSCQIFGYFSREYCICSDLYCSLSIYDVFFFLMIRRPPRSTLDRSSAASDVYKRQGIEPKYTYYFKQDHPDASLINLRFDLDTILQYSLPTNLRSPVLLDFCLLYTSPSPRDRTRSRMPSSA